ncbi:hypothetical protein VPH35_101337 [Triticum aestivum]
MSCYPQHMTELVSAKILLRLPVNSLLRFRCVCKAWRDTIDNDFFVRAHLRLRAESTFTLIAPHVKAADGRITAAGLYSMQDAATLVHPMPMGADYSVPGTTNVSHDLAHCDGLVLVPSDTVGHQAFGLGHDPRSKAYKVARFFYGRVLTSRSPSERWRETAAPPPYHVLPGRTATFFKDSLLWTVEELLLREAPGFIRFKLDDESPSLDYAAASLAELRAELCAARHEADYGDGSHETWICRDLDETRHRHDGSRGICLHYTDVLVLHAEPCYLCRQTQEPGRSEEEERVPLHMQLQLRSYHRDTGVFVEYPTETCDFQVISYVPSLAPV